VDLKLFGEVFVTLLVIVDPPGMVPVFLALTAFMNTRQRMVAGSQAVDWRSA
jgi:multiple antibiotic resistance protein